MPIQVISGTTPANTGQLATPATTNFSIAFVSASYSASYATSSATPASRSVAITAFSVDGIRVVFSSGSTAQTNTADTIYINNVPFNTAYSAIQGITSAVSASTGVLFSIGTTGSYDNAYNLNTQYTAVSGSTTLTFGGASMFGPTSSGIVTGSWTSILASADAQLVISGSGIGQAGFVLTTGTTFNAPSGSTITAITVVNPQGTVVAS